MAERTDGPIHPNAPPPLTAGSAQTLEAWQDEQTRRAIAEADAGDFATSEEVEATIRKFVPHG